MSRSKVIFILIIIISSSVFIFSIFFKKTEQENDLQSCEEQLENTIGFEVTFVDELEYSYYDCYEFKDEYDNVYWMDKTSYIIEMISFSENPTYFTDQEGSIEEKCIEIIGITYPAFLIDGYVIDVMNYDDGKQRVVCRQTNDEGVITGNHYKIYVDNNNNIISLELYNNNNPEYDVISEDDAISVAYDALDSIVVEMRKVIRNADINEEKDSLMLSRKIGSNYSFSYPVKIENLDYYKLQQIKYDAETDKSESHSVSVKLVSNEYALLYLIIIDNVENNVDEAYDGENPGSKFLITINAYTGIVYRTSFEIISREGVLHLELY